MEIGISGGERLMSPPTTIKVGDYLKMGRRDFVLCFSCRAFGQPLPVATGDSHGLERRCRVCRQESTVPLHRAVSERWLRVEVSR